MYAYGARTGRVEVRMRSGVGMSTSRQGVGVSARPGRRSVGLAVRVRWGA